MAFALTALCSAALVACGGGGGGSTPPPASGPTSTQTSTPSPSPTATPTPLPTVAPIASATLTGAAAIPLPQFLGMSGNVAFTQFNASTVLVTQTFALTVPIDIPALQSAVRHPSTLVRSASNGTTIVYDILTFSTDVVFSGFPAYTFAFSAGTPSGNYSLAFFDTARTADGWIFPVDGPGYSVTQGAGFGVSFAGNRIPIHFASNQKYVVALYSTVGTSPVSTATLAPVAPPSGIPQRTPSPSPSPSPTPTPSPSPSPSPSPTPAPTLPPSYFSITPYYISINGIGNTRFAHRGAQVADARERILRDAWVFGIRQAVVAAGEPGVFIDHGAQPFGRL